MSEVSGRGPHPTTFQSFVNKCFVKTLIRHISIKIISFVFKNLNLSELPLTQTEKKNLAKKWEVEIGKQRYYFKH
jgi:hypothetical protein